MGSKSIAHEINPMNVYGGLPAGYAPYVREYFTVNFIWSDQKDSIALLNPINLN
jgi:hypothetical protein